MISSPVMMSCKRVNTECLVLGAMCFSARAGCGEAQQGRRGSCAGRGNGVRAGVATHLVNDHIGGVVYVQMW